MSFVKIWIHAVWTTKNREKILVKEVRGKLFEHIKFNGVQKGILIDTINGHSNHIHCLFRLKNDQTVMKCIQMLKGESSFWANRQKILPRKLFWQKEYFAVSVSESSVEKVRAYIDNQEEHHQKMSWQQEYDQIISKFKFNVF